MVSPFGFGQVNAGFQQTAPLLAQLLRHNLTARRNAFGSLGAGLAGGVSNFMEGQRRQEEENRRASKELQDRIDEQERIKRESQRFQDSQKHDVALAQLRGRIAGARQDAALGAADTRANLDRQQKERQFNTRTDMLREQAKHDRERERRQDFERVDAEQFRRGQAMGKAREDAAHRKESLAIQKGRLAIQAQNAANAAAATSAKLIREAAHEAARTKNKVLATRGKIVNQLNKELTAMSRRLANALTAEGNAPIGDPKAAKAVADAQAAYQAKFQEWITASSELRGLLGGAAPASLPAPGGGGDDGGFAAEVDEAANGG